MGESERLSRRERERERHREEIMAAALRIFSQKGYQATSIQEIAQEAEFAVGTLYNFFPGKEQLFEAVMLRVGEDMLSLLSTHLSQPGNPLVALLRAAEAIIEMVQERREVLTLFLGTMPPHGTSLARPIEECDFRSIHTAWYDQIHDCFRRAVDEGLLKPLDPAWYAVSFIGMGSAWFWQVVADPVTFPAELPLRLIRELFLEPALLVPLP